MDSGSRWRMSTPMNELSITPALHNYCQVHVHVHVAVACAWGVVLAYSCLVLQHWRVVVSDAGPRWLCAESAVSWVSYGVWARGEGLGHRLLWHTEVQGKWLNKFSSLLEDPSGRELRLSFCKPNLWARRKELDIHRCNTGCCCFCTLFLHHLLTSGHQCTCKFDGWLTH